jgi:amidohydrolase
MTMTNPNAFPVASDRSRFAAEASALLPELRELRRELHREAEIGLDLPRTQAIILRELEPLGLEITLGQALTSVTAVLRGAHDGPAVLLRADMDALPIAEESGEAFAATGAAMHACGHDLHVAGLIGAARVLAAHREELHGSVVFMFQPGEEGAGGAALMLSEGVLDAAGRRVEAAYGIHVVIDDFGRFATKGGPLMGGANSLHVTMTGRGGHGSAPYLAVDPVPALAESILALQNFVTRRFDVFDPVVASVTQLRAGEVMNAIPDSAQFSATVRTLSHRSTELLERELPPFFEHIAAAHGCRADVEFSIDFPATVNDPAAADRAIAEISALLGPARVTRVEHPRMASEDFSHVLREVPGAFVFLGAAHPGTDLDTAEFNHTPRVRFDDGVLAEQAAVLAALAASHLEAKPADQ